MGPSVLLISLPWTTLNEPSLGLGILRAVLDGKGIPCRVVHLNLFLLEHLRAHTYSAIANVFSLNDFLFSGVLDPMISHKQERWLRLKTQNLLWYKVIDERQFGGLDGVIQQLLHLRQVVIPAWLAHWADELGRSNATLVGLTCMFDQTIPSIAFAYMLKQRAPDKLIALGGYAIRPPTGEAVLRAFSCIDVICTGEGEPVIEALAHASAGEIPLRDVPSILYRRPGGGISATPSAPLMDMNQIPIPNYDDFFADLKKLKELYQVEIDVDRLPIENSRGCWWGQTRHCVFCGIHDDDMAYRFREGICVLNVMDSMAESYGLHSFRFSDYILPYQYYRTLLPEMVRRGKPYQITSEIKSNINAQRFALLAAAGFNDVQPGIESFSSSVLRKMSKGVSAIRNVYVLLLGKMHGVAIHYNILYGLPNDEDQEYEAIIRALPRFFHLDPPSARVPLQITRYAPIQANPKRFGISSATYEPSYDLIFSESFLEKSGFDLNDLCYYFDRPFENSTHLNRLYREINRLVDIWKSEQARREVCLWYEEEQNGLKIFDSRSEPSTLTHLRTIEANVFLAASEPISVENLWQQFMGLIEREEFNEILKRLDVIGLIFQENGWIIGLALPHNMNSSSRRDVVSRF